jgi:hypothetical protein
MEQAAATVQSAPLFVEETTIDEEPNLKIIDEGEVIDEAYANWWTRYGKTTSASQFSTFKKNFLVLEEYNRKAGRSFLLNEYGDSTEGASLKLSFSLFCL